MHVDDRFNAIAEDPVGRLIRVLESSRANASRREQRNPVVRTDVDRGQIRQLRLTAGSGRREILALRRELDRLRLVEPRGREEKPDVGDGPAPEPISYARKSYAPDPVGAVTAIPDEPPPAPPPIPVANHYHVTNLGTLLDVLA